MIFGRGPAQEPLQSPACGVQNVLERLGRLSLIGEIEIAVGAHHGYRKGDSLRSVNGAGQGVYSGATFALRPGQSELTYGVYSIAISLQEVFFGR